jgi:hypothetical protein
MTYTVYILCISKNLNWISRNFECEVFLAGPGRGTSLAPQTVSSQRLDEIDGLPHKYSNRQKDAFECGCADGAGPTSRRGSHVYEINTWLWNFGRPQPRVGDLSVAKTEKLRRKSRSEASKRGWATKRARKWPLHEYAWYIHGIYHGYTVYILSDNKSCFLSAIQ